MRSDELVTATLRAAFLPTTHPTYTSAVVLAENNNTFSNVFATPIQESLGNYWLHRYDTTTTANRPRYRIPARALMGGLQKLQMANAAGNYYDLDEATPAQVPGFAGDSASSTQFPGFYDVLGDQIELLPQPANDGTPLRMSYYLRPSRMVTSQSSTLGGDAAVRGQITAVGWPANRTVTVNAVPFDQDLAVPAVLTTAVQRIDIVHPNGWRELSLVGATQTLAGLVFTVGGTDSLADVEVGDFVRVAEQTDWPCLPDEFQQTLADATAVRLLLQQNIKDKAAALAQKIGLTPDGPQPGTDLDRFRRIIAPRNQTQPKRVVRRTGILYGSGAFPRFGRGWVT